DVAVNNLTVRMGHFYTIIGYEVVPAPDNFFYSHTYAMQYGEPFTHTGLLATYEVDRHLTISGGFGRGWDNWEDNNSDLSFLGGVTTTSCDGRTAVSLALSTGDYDDAAELNRTMYSLVFSRQVSDRFSYIIQYDWGRDEQGGVPGFDGGWYGINNEMFYCVNDQWDIGFRLEWFRDADGTRVGGIGAPNGWTLGPDIDRNRIGWAGTFWEITIGANWSPYENVVVRPECRWDWYDGQAAFGGVLPYNSGRSLDQFTFATDLIISF
ncbi:MAG: outer membrane beta-barrel protein, partial [Thermoguttaceae bacterium]